jgi:hypothetical protein
MKGKKSGMEKFCCTTHSCQPHNESIGRNQVFKSNMNQVQGAQGVKAMDKIVYILLYYRTVSARCFM